MKKELLIATSIFLLIATPAIAKDNNNGNKEEKSQSPKAEQVNNSANTNNTNNGNHGKKEVLGEQVSQIADVTPTIDPTLTPTVAKQRVLPAQDEACDPNAQWKNHGKYVSCVAKLHLGGQVTSQAARSDIGKKKAAITPTVTPTSTPSATPTPLDITPTPPITGPETELTFSPVENIKGFFKKIGDFFKNLI